MDHSLPMETKRALMKNTISEKIFRKNDIRGIYKKDFDLNFVKVLGFSFVQLCLQMQKKKSGPNKKLTIALGHDCRLSSPEIAQCLARSLALAGAEIRFLGMLPSPVCFFANHSCKNIHASIIVTASHNPPFFNGFKMMIDKESICNKKIFLLKKIAQEESCTPASTKGEIVPFNIKPSYIAFYQKNFSFPIHHKSKPTSIKTIAIDCGNGASGPIAQKIFKALKLPLNIHWLYTKPDGHFPHHPPDPSMEKNLEDLQKKIKEKSCDFGAAFDGDGDRLFIVGKKGKVLHGDELMSIFISDIVEQSPATSSNVLKDSSVIADVKCADWFFNFLKKKHIQTTIWKSGHSLIRQKTLKKRALFGGELSGHFFFCDDFFLIDDGLYALLRLIKISFQTGKNPEDLIPKKNSVETNEIRSPIKDMNIAKTQLEKLKSHYKKEPLASCIFIDGVRVSFPGKAWGLARLSNTQNEWTFRFGGKTKRNLKTLQKDFYKLLNIPIEGEKK